MSKSLGNFIDLELLLAYAKRYSLDALRWYLLTQGPLGNNDADFAHAKFVEVFNADLANGIGNSTSRVGNMIAKYFDGKLPKSIEGLRDWVSPVKFEVVMSKSRTSPARKEKGTASTSGVGSDVGIWDSLAVTSSWEKPALAPAAVCLSVEPRLNGFQLSGALELGLGLASGVDLFINRTQPFKLAKLADADPSKKEELANILTVCAEALRVAALLLSPAMPRKMNQVLQEWSSLPPQGVPLAELVRLDGPHSLKAGTPIVKGAILFQRADPAEPAPSAAAPPSDAAAGGQ